MSGCSPEPRSEPTRPVCRLGEVAGLRALLERHPKVAIDAAAADVALEFDHHGTNRRIVVGDTAALFGLVELMDNNPLVCAKVVGVPDALSTLGLIALGPPARACLLLEPPSIAIECNGDPASLGRSMRACGLEVSPTVHLSPVVGTVVSATAELAVATPDDLGEVDALFHEAYGRSFFVRRDDGFFRDATAVRGKPYAVYGLQVAPGGRQSTLTVRVAADLHGKCGAAQIVHVMNIMAGFEETLGLDS